ncbi:juvenile hormone epoxide hydrolase-like [Manduca sexta]|uniref:juvenile hormone epoxide hydrolase-like n=1 Tax=Manduca sexta TaxID=7130 RepID=UPI00188F6E2C|nr:juvenile hormone epoxide hydrolase-like [Manduca sexta]
MARLLLILIPVLVISIPLYFLFFKSPPPVPDFDLNEWWGPQSLKSKQDTSVRPFKISFSDAMVKELKDRLNKRRRPLTPPLEGVGFEYGFNSNQIEAWTKYWAEEYPFAEREKFLNKYPHFKTNIQGLDIHFMRIKPEVGDG